MLQILFKVLNLRKSLHFNHPTRKNLENITNTIISYKASCMRIIVQILSLFTKCKCSSKLSFLALICVLFFRWSTPDNTSRAFYYSMQIFIFIWLSNISHRVDNPELCFFKSCIFFFGMEFWCKEVFGTTLTSLSLVTNGEIKWSLKLGT